MKSCEYYDECIQGVSSPRIQAELCYNCGGAATKNSRKPKKPAKKLQRFKAALTCGSPDSDNPEDLRRDGDGEFVLFNDAVALINEALQWNWGESEYLEIPKEVRDKFKVYM